MPRGPREVRTASAKAFAAAMFATRTSRALAVVAEVELSPVRPCCPERIKAVAWWLFIGVLFVPLRSKKSDTPQRNDTAEYRGRRECRDGLGSAQARFAALLAKCTREAASGAGTGAVHET